MSITFKDNSAEVLAAMEAAKKKALTAIGLAAVEVTNDYMKKKYGPGSKGAGIYDSGDLMRSISYNVRQSEDIVDVGTDLEYAEWVHNGTRRMPARPFLRDAIMENHDIWKEIAEEHIGEEIK